mmetsp:Transcript_56973/g.120959  ORF Transcript_56973/g.120959 Transcript_56973/m.120959 type:complete len:248 (-) Transcript_56973:403-1146(-)
MLAVLADGLADDGLVVAHSLGLFLVRPRLFRKLIWCPVFVEHIFHNFLYGIVWNFLCFILWCSFDKSSSSLLEIPFPLSGLLLDMIGILLLLAQGNLDLPVVRCSPSSRPVKEVMLVMMLGTPVEEVTHIMCHVVRGCLGVAPRQRPGPGPLVLLALRRRGARSPLFAVLCGGGRDRRGREHGIETVHRPAHGHSPPIPCRSGRRSAIQTVLRLGHRDGTLVARNGPVGVAPPGRQSLAAVVGVARF